MSLLTRECFVQMVYPSTRVVDVLTNIKQTVAREDDAIAFSMNGVVPPTMTVASLTASNIDYLFVIFVAVLWFPQD